ncbi:MAG: hemerythrin domain-containing protein [Deltaproteobacteria bacterium]|nr:hemerythrin domain-containing protein [Deltaproteobacteria bacterium]
MPKKTKSNKSEPAAIKMLKDQHREVEELFEEFEGAAQNEDSEKARELAGVICEKLTLHATIEEEIFYPAAQSEETADQLEEAAIEHISAKRLIADVAEATSDKKLKALMSVLKEQIEHHVEEEEEELFPKAQEALSEDEMGPLATHMEERLEELKERGLGKLDIQSAAEAGDEDEEDDEDADEEDDELDDADDEEEDDEESAELDEEEDEAEAPKRMPAIAKKTAGRRKAS